MRANRVLAEALEHAPGHNVIPVLQADRGSPRAMSLGFTGAMLRGSGVAWDLRKKQPYEVE